MTEPTLTAERTTTPETEKPQTDHDVIIFAGLNMTHFGSQSLINELRQLYNTSPDLTTDSMSHNQGENKVTFYDSLILGDRPDPSRFLKMAESISQSIDAKKSTWILYSLGATEFRVAWEIFVKKYPEKAKQVDMSKIELVLMSPSGLINTVTDVKNLLVGFKRLLESQGANSPYRVIETTNTFPPKTIVESVFSNALRQAYPDLSDMTHWEQQTAQRPSKITRTVGVQDRDYRTTIPAAMQANMQDYDLKLAAILQEPDSDEKWEQFRTELAHRAKYINDNHEKVFSGRVFPENKDKEPEDAQIRKVIAQSILGVPRLLHTLFLGKNPDFFQSMQDKGANVTFVIPEYDTFLPLPELMKFLSPETDLVFMEGATHISLINKTDNLAAALRFIEEKRRAAPTQ